MDTSPKRTPSVLNTRRVWIPILLGLSIVAYFLIRDAGGTAASLQLISDAKPAYIVLALLSIALRDWGYAQRIRVLTGKKVSWKDSLLVILLWEFSSAVTPSVAGGGVVAVFLLTRVGITPGNALAYIIVTTIFDNLFFILASSLGYWGFYEPFFASLSTVELGLGKGIKWLFWLSHLIVIAYSLVAIFALFIRPNLFRGLLLRITSIRFLKRWQSKARQYGDEMVDASHALREAKPNYWIKVGLTTLAAWIPRYATLNFLSAAYVPLSLMEHLSAFGKQVIMWTVMLVSPTPGSSGTAEFFFQQLYAPTLGDYTLAVGLSWRLLTYYLYLFIGVILLPRWLGTKK